MIARARLGGQLMTADPARVDPVGPQQPFVLPARIAVALVQAALLYSLNEAALPKTSWPATIPSLFDALLLIGIFTPLVLLVGLGKIRVLPLAIWGVIVTALVGALGWYGASRGGYIAFARSNVRMPDAQLWLALIGTIFVGHVLFVDSILERRPMPSYPLHFDTAWKQCVQLLLAVAFALVFWSVLLLGSALFKAINIDLFEHILRDRWFQYPATTLAIAVSLHVTDVQPSLIRGARTLALTLFSWLLPLLAAIMLAFLVSLPFMSLQVLWKTHFAGSLMLTAAGLLILLINSCYQDGADEQTTSRIKRIATLVAAVELVPIVALAAWALVLRVEQYGWTVQRIFSGAITLVEACYAMGYAAAAIRAPVWMKRIEVVNFVTAYVLIAVTIALFSPIADPARTMVTDQMARLKSGATRPGDFDYWALKSDGAHWGRDALAQLSQTAAGPNADLIRTRAKQAMSALNRYMTNRQTTPDEFANLITVYPAGRRLPPDLASTMADPTNTFSAVCSMPGAVKCFARLMTLAPGQPEDVLVGTPYMAWLYARDDKGHWTQYQLSGSEIGCSATLATDPIQLVPHGQPDIIIGNRRLVVEAAPGPCTQNGSVSVIK